MKFKKQHIIFTSITCFVVLLSCTQQRIDPDMAIFQQELGEENIAMIDLLVEEFEDHLDTHYPDLKTSEAYNQLLKDVSDWDTTNDSILVVYQSKKSRENFRASSLYSELYIKEPYIGSEVEKMDKLYDINITPPPGVPNNETKRPTPDTLYSLNISGKYMQALYTIKKKDSIIEMYYNIRKSYKPVPNDRFSINKLFSNSDFDDYIYKRIIVLENIFWKRLELQG